MHWKSIAVTASVAGVLATAPGDGNFYVPMFVTKVTWQTRTC
ncbi:hypothetical protein [Micromonospora sp. NPDC005979]